MRLTVYCDGRVVLTSPFGIEQSLVEKFLANKKWWIWDKLQFFKNKNQKAVRKFSRKDYLANKERALLLAKERVEFFNHAYNFPINKIFIKNQKTRWGSCSKQRNLNLNYKIVFLPEQHQNYIIVHELCHLKEFNHSRNFWALVAKTIPNYASIRKELRHPELLYG